MTILEIFERVNLMLPLAQRLFINYLNDTQSELETMFNINLLTIYGTQMDIHADSEIGEGLPDGEVDTTKTYFDTETETYYTYATAWEVLSIIDVPMITSLTSITKIAPLYHIAMVDNILYMATNSEAFKVGFINKARQAYSTYWGKHAKGKKMGRRTW